METVTSTATPPVCPIPSCNSAKACLRLRVIPDQPVESSWGVVTNDVIIYECPKCGLLFRYVPTDSAVEEFYGADYHLNMIGTGETPHKRLLFARQENEERIRYLKRFCPGGRVLDVGCSTG